MIARGNILRAEAERLFMLALMGWEKQLRMLVVVCK